MAMRDEAESKSEHESQSSRDGSGWIKPQSEEQRRFFPPLQLLESVFQNTNNSILITTAQLAPPGPEIVYVNPYFTAMTGYAPDEVIGKTPRILQGPKTDRKVLERLRHNLSNGKCFVGQAINYRKDGSEFHMEWRIAPIRAADGEITHFVAVQNDVSEFKAAEASSRAALLESQARYDELFEHANDIIFTADLEKRFTSINETTVDITGFTRDELLGAEVSLIVPPEHLDKVREMLRSKVQTGKPTTYEIEILTKDGKYVPIEVSSRLIYENGEPAGIQGIARDITERKQSDAALRIAAATFKTHECIMVTDERGTILRVNERFTEITGYSAAEAVGMNPRILKSGRHGKEFYRQMWAAIKDKGFWEGEVWNRRKNREVFPQHLTITAVQDESRRTTHYVAIAQDITVRKRAEQQLLVANESLRHSHAELERRNLELQQMTYAASHDLQEPLRSISSYSQLVDRGYRDSLDDEGRSWLDAIVRNTKRMQALIQDLRAYTVLDAPCHSFDAIDLEKVLADAVANLTSSIQDSGAEVTFDPLPIIKGNPSQLVQLFQNLIGNAIKYRSKETPKVHISAEQDDESWIISVSDNGIGIETKHHDTIFEIFRRLHHRHEQPGTGIGLAICRRVVQQHHGNISVDSAVNQGSTFRFTIPIEQEEVRA